MGERAMGGGPIELDRRIDAAVLRHAGRARVVLAVSGGRDSMVLLAAAARTLPSASVLVATFDHATGAHAERAVAHVARAAASCGFACVVGRADTNPGTEAGWRVARRAFLGDVAGSFGGRVVTAHTRDDQVETILMRLLRDAGPRGLAGLYSGHGIRPLLEFSRADITDYARRRGVRWLDDPTNESPAYLRNRVRRDLRPALRLAAPDLDDALLTTARAAADIRARLDEWVDRHAVSGSARAFLREADVRDREPSALALLWPAVGARVGLAMDWRGTARAVAFTKTGRVGGRIPLSGGWRITRSREGFELHRETAALPESPLRAGLDWNGWRFETTNVEAAGVDAWMAQLPAGGLTVRAWTAADRMCANGTTRRVKRFLSDAGITGEPRARWPVVLSGDEIVWIPGVRRSDAAAVRPGRPGMLLRCDYDRR